jgi:hypothetical protein
MKKKKTEEQLHQPRATKVNEYKSFSSSEKQLKIQRKKNIAFYEIITDHPDIN